MLRLLFTQCKLSPLVVCKETFFIMSPLYFLSLFFFKVDHILSPQAYVTSTIQYDKCKISTFLSDPTWHSELKKKLALGRPNKLLHYDHTKANSVQAKQRSVYSTFTLYIYIYIYIYIYNHLAPFGNWNDQTD
jgi:hypothetical protein